jgi:transposase
MSKSNRNAPKRAQSSESRYTIMDFERDFPDDAACMDWLMVYLYPEGIFCPKCQKVTKHHRVKARTCYACQFCGHQEYPMRGTIFQDSATSLKLWFHGIFLMSQTRCGISAKQLERELGVTYKTAWRMFNKIRSLLADDDNEDGDGMLAGEVEVDELRWGGKDKWRHRDKKRGHMAMGDKIPVMGFAQRKTATEPGRIVAKVMPDLGYRTLVGGVTRKVLPRSAVYTDEAPAYDALNHIGYRHSRVNHSQEVYVAGEVHTNTVEGFWSLVRRGIGGVYHSVSTEHLQSYLNEYTFRYNNRSTERGMFNAFLNRIVKAPAAAPATA